MRVLIAELKQETSTFNPAPTRYDAFRIQPADQLIAAYRGTQTELAGALDTFAEDGRVTPVPGMAAAAVSGGPIPTTDLDRLLSEVRGSIQAAGAVDAAYLCLHGAMAGESEPDPEGRLLTAAREVLGDVPIVASLDLHAILTQQMLDAADVLVPYHTYPHTDHYSTGQRSARILLGLLDRKIQPTTALIELPMLVRGDELLTATGKFGEAIQMCREVEQSTAGVAAGVIIGNAFTDVPALQSNVVVTTDNDLAGAEQTALDIARFMWRHRELFRAELTSLDDAIQIAAATAGLTVFSDAADATASGAAGDSNAILTGLIAAGFSRPTLLSIVDAAAVTAALAAGIGRSVAVTLGGTLDPGRFTPLPVEATVRSLHDGHFTYEDGTAGRAGCTAVLQVGPIQILVTERPVYVVGRRVYQQHGLEPTDFELVVVKSPNGFRTWYESIATRIVPVDVPGSTSANLKSLPFAHCVRPTFPLDDNVTPPFSVE